MKLIITKNTITGSYNNKRLFVYRGGFQSRYPKTKILPTFSAIANRQNNQVLRRFSIFRVAHLRTSFKNTFFLVFWRKNCFALDWRDYSVVWFRDTTRDSLFFFCVVLFWTFLKNVFFRFFRQFFRSDFPDKRAGRNHWFACFFRGSCAATWSQPLIGKSRFLTILQRCWSWRCSHRFTFWSSSWRKFGRRQISA